MTYLLPAEQMAMLCAARRLLEYPVWLLRPQFSDRKIETAGSPEKRDVLDREQLGKNEQNHFFMT